MDVSSTVRRVIKRNLNDQTSYKDLQYLAKCFHIPCNLKKETLRSAIQAYLNGQEELVNAIVKQVKDERSLRRIQLKEEALNKRSTQSMRIIKIKGSHTSTACNNNTATCNLQDVVVESKVEETTCNNVTIRKTELKAQYRSLITPMNVTVTRCNTPVIKPTPLRKLMPVSTKDDTILRSLLSTTPRPIYSSPKLKLKSKTVFTTRQYGDFPQQTSRMKTIPYQPSSSGERAFPDFSLETILLNSSRPQDSSKATTAEFCTPVASVYPLTHPELDDNKMNDLPYINTNDEQGPTTSDNAISSLDYLAQMASLIEGEGLQERMRTSEQDSLADVNNFSIGGSEFIVPNSNQNLQEIPTWNNFLEQRSSRVQPRIEKCKFDCPVICQTNEEKLNHESICLRQPLPCPSINCYWVNQLGSLTSHIFNYHNSEVILTSEATFNLNFGNDLPYNSLVFRGCFDGPTRQTFYQMVNRRLFVTFVIGNFQSMQLCIYVQYVDDFLHWESTGAIEVLCPNGVPYQWKGKLFPLSWNATRLIPNRRCLVLNMNNFPRVQRFVIHVKIRNHEPPL